MLVLTLFFLDEQLKIFGKGKNRKENFVALLFIITCIIDGFLEIRSIFDIIKNFLTL